MQLTMTPSIIPCILASVITEHTVILVIYLLFEVVDNLRTSFVSYFNVAFNPVYLFK